MSFSPISVTEEKATIIESENIIILRELKNKLAEIKTTTEGIKETLRQKRIESDRCILSAAEHLEKYGYPMEKICWFISQGTGLSNLRPILPAKYKDQAQRNASLKGIQKRKEKKKKRGRRSKKK